MDTLNKISEGGKVNIAITPMQEGAEGYYHNGTIHLNESMFKGDTLNEKGILTVAKHELTHHIENSLDYAKFHDYVLNSNAMLELLQDKNLGLDEYRAEIANTYKAKGIELDQQAIDREIVAKFVGDNLFTDEQAITKLATKNKSLWEKVKQFISDMVARLKGTPEQQFYLKAERLYKKALRTVDSGNVVGAEVKYSVSSKEMYALIKNIFSQNPIKLMVGDREIIARFDTVSAKKNAYGNKNSNRPGLEYKFNNATEIPSIIKSSVYDHSTAESGKNPDSLAHKGVKEWHYFINSIPTDSGIVDITVNVRDKGNEQFIYEVAYQIKKGQSRDVRQEINLDPTLKTIDPTKTIPPNNDIVNSSIRNNNKNDTKKYSINEPAEQDSAGKKLTPAQVEFFKDSKVRDESGRLIPIDGFYINAGSKPKNLELSDRQKRGLEIGSIFKEHCGSVQTDYSWYRFYDDYPHLADEMEYAGNKKMRSFEIAVQGEMPTYRIAIRHGKVPNNGRSTNWATKGLEQGVSTVSFLNEKTQGEKTIYDVIYGMQNIDKYIVGGWDYGIFGSDGEPLLVNAEIIVKDNNIHNIKKINNTNPTSDPDIRYSINEPTMSELVDKYGAIKPGEKQYRDYKVAKKTSKAQYVSHFARTMAESKVLPEQEVSTLEKLILSGKVSHEVVTDKESLKFAENMLKGDGWEHSIDRWQSVANGDKIADKNDIALGQMIFNQAINAKDVDLAMRTAAELAAEATRAGQTVQAFRLLKKMSPDYLLYSLFHIKRVSNRHSLLFFYDEFIVYEINLIIKITYAIDKLSVILYMQEIRRCCMNKEEILYFIKSRRSIRRYTDQKIDRDILIDLVRTGMYAPNAENQQLWEFIIIDDPAIFTEIANFHPYGTMTKYAQAVIIVAGDIRKPKSFFLWPQDLAAATQNILLAAHAYGLGAVWVGTYPKEHFMEMLRKLCNLPDYIMPFSIISLGYPARELLMPDRFKEDKIHFNIWQK